MINITSVINVIISIMIIDDAINDITIMADIAAIIIDALKPYEYHLAAVVNAWILLDLANSS